MLFRSEVEVACLYAQQNGFTSGGNGGKQNVTVATGTTTPPPTAPGVNGIYYWVTVRVTQSTPIWFGKVVADATSGRRVGDVQSAAAQMQCHRRHCEPELELICCAVRSIERRHAGVEIEREPVDVERCGLVHKLVRRRDERSIPK